MQTFTVHKLNDIEVIHIDGVDYKQVKVEAYQAGYPDSVENKIVGTDDDGNLIVVLGEKRHILEDNKITIVDADPQRFWLTPVNEE